MCIQVDANGCSWRSGAKVEQRYLNQWFFRITAYAEVSCVTRYWPPILVTPPPPQELLKGLDDVDWPESVKLIQANWIGKSDGAYIDFDMEVVCAAADGLNVM